MYYNVLVLVKSGIMGGLCYGCLYVFDKPLVQLLVGIIVGVISYFIMAVMTKDETFYDVKQIILKKKKQIASIWGIYAENVNSFMLFLLKLYQL